METSARTTSCSLAEMALRPLRCRAFVVPALMVTGAVALDIATSVVDPSLEWTSLHAGKTRGEIAFSILRYALISDFLITMITYIIMAINRCKYARFGWEFWKLGRGRPIYNRPNIVTMAVFMCVYVSLARLSGFINNLLVLAFNYGLINMAIDIGLDGRFSILLFIFAIWIMPMGIIASLISMRLTKDGCDTAVLQRNLK